MVQHAAILTVPLTVAVHRIKKPCIYAGFDNLMTDETLIVFVLTVILTGYNLKLWLAVGVVYAGLFAVLGDSKTTTAKKLDE